MAVISTNTAANSAIRYLNINSDSQSTYLTQIASGSRITRASDDASSLAIGTKLQADVSVLDQAATNASNAISVLETADGGLSEISDILERMKTLATQSQSGSVTDEERAYIEAEYDELEEELDAQATSTRFNGESLLDGTSSFASGVSFLVGTDSSDTITVTLDEATISSLGLTGASVATSSDAESTEDLLDAAIDTLSAQRAYVGAMESRFEFRSSQIESSQENLDSAQSDIMDVDIAEAQSDLSSAEVLTQAAISALAEANEMPQNLLTLLQ